MNQGGQILPSLQGLIDLFLDRCSEKSTLQELQQLLKNDDRWIEAHALFNRIRDKTLKVERRKDRLLAIQYSFEEICAKTLFNLSDTNAPFDPDSPYFVIPFAIHLARALQMKDEDVIEIVAPRGSGTQI
jgi:hypothetical protein